MEIPEFGNEKNMNTAPSGITHHRMQAPTLYCGNRNPVPPFKVPVFQVNMVNAYKPSRCMQNRTESHASVRYQSPNTESEMYSASS